MNDQRIRLVVNPNEIDLQALSRLLESVNMRRRSPDALQRALRASSMVVAAYDGAELMGFGRMIDDGEYYGSIWDVAVSPEKQGQGIGTAIVERMIGEAARKGLYMIGLFTEIERNRSFYEKLGFDLKEGIHAMTRLTRQEPEL